MESTPRILQKSSLRGNSELSELSQCQSDLVFRCGQSLYFLNIGDEVGLISTDFSIAILTHSVGLTSCGPGAPPPGKLAIED